MIISLCTIMHIRRGNDMSPFSNTECCVLSGIAAWKQFYCFGQAAIDKSPQAGGLGNRYSIFKVPACITGRNTYGHIILHRREENKFPRKQLQTKFSLYAAL